MQKILMVCLGNICRSPLAEGILTSKVDSDLVYVDSAGTAAYHVGNLPDKRSIQIAAKHGINIRNQRARKFTEQDFDNFDVIYAMDQSNYKNIKSLARSKEDEIKVKLILNETHPEMNDNVPDPYYGGNEGFQNVYQMLDKACEIIASKL
ncbi:low molecular weight phosphotyrosine protein phosphatase [Polaribacter sp. WD7]|uniref:low molecular weight protein-tyrosine-phosphatase n=1 Tax=Polaribacter sp. WD7 TaxID=2269061 RepID=UPI000DF21D67|nr:low molecular weight protein-tyrosine-phosphatase [Polaribacter sp. WD7]RCS27531.1 low molecular weight phosphotyrosine protein phosphatase [Polaribacter sp. WD7]